MAKEDTEDAEFSLLSIEVAGTSKEMKSPLRKRRKLSSPMLEICYEPPPTVEQTEYKSPLIHLGKINSRNDSTSNLDESIVVIHERIHSAPFRPRTSVQSENKQPDSLDDSVIILSEHEEESTREFSKTDRLNLTEITTVKKNTPKLRSTSLRGRVRAKNATKRTPLRQKQRLMTRTQSISIDSEDENTNSNEDLSKSKSQVAVISIDSSPRVETDVNTPNDATEESPKDTNSSSHCSESPSLSSSRTDDVSVVWVATEGLCTAADQLAALDSAEKISKRKKCPVLCSDTKGDPTSLRRINAKSKLAGKSFRGKKKRQNPNWASFVKNSSSARAAVKEQTRELNQPEENAVGRYYTKERLVKGPGSLRNIVIDGCNVATAYTNGKFFSEDGLKLVIDYFQLRGHTVKAFVPQHKRSFKHHLLEKLYTEGTVVFTPSRRIGGRTISSYDDRYILDYATMCDGIVVSLDQYRDLYKEKPEWKNTIENRLLVPTFVGECVMFPEDPLGRKGPKLEDFLRH